MAKLDKAYANDKTSSIRKSRSFTKARLQYAFGMSAHDCDNDNLFVMFGGLNQCSAYVNLKVYSELSVHYTDTLSAELSKHTEEYESKRYDILLSGNRRQSRITRRGWAVRALLRALSTRK